MGVIPRKMRKRSRIGQRRSGLRRYGASDFVGVAAAAAAGDLEPRLCGGVMYVENSLANSLSSEAKISARAGPTLESKLYWAKFCTLSKPWAALRRAATSASFWAVTTSA